MEQQGEAATQDEGVLSRAQRFVFHDLWQLDLRPRTWTASALRLLQFAVMVGQGFVRDRLLLRASSLTYVTTLSLIPLLVVTVSLIGLVGGQRSLVDMVVDQLTVVSPEVKDYILGQLQGVRIGSLGTVGATVLVFTTVLALRHLEESLNDIWGARVGRGWMRRFADYLAVLIVAPLLTAAAISLGATLQSEPLVEKLLGSPLFSALYYGGLSYLPSLLYVVAFTFLYWFFPNTSVRLTSALLGGIVATILFSMVRWAFVEFSIGSARSSVLFGSLVALPLILTWIYVCWAVVLLGAEVAFAHQNLRHYRRELKGLAPGPAAREEVGLRVVVEVARAFCHHQTPPSADDLANDLEAPVRAVRELLAVFDEGGILVACGQGDREVGYLPARPVHDITVSDVMRALRGGRRQDDAVAPAGDAVRRVLTAMEAAALHLGEDRMIQDLVESQATAAQADESEAGQLAVSDGGEA
jgi:membrane protein